MLRKLTRVLTILSLTGLLLLLYLGVQGEAIAATRAQAILSDPSGSSALEGQAVFTETPAGLEIEASISGAPAGLHGFHIHENGRCADGGNAAGGHFNPDGVQHGKLNVDGFEKAHAGDLGNFMIDRDGRGSSSQTVRGLSLSQGKYAIANRAVILHVQRDDFSQPTGNAGARLGCGEIKLD
jgi:Cu-Zn family superoxide dismutase